VDPLDVEKACCRGCSALAAADGAQQNLGHNPVNLRAEGNEHNIMWRDCDGNKPSIGDPVTLVGAIAGRDVLGGSEHGSVIGFGRINVQVLIDEGAGSMAGERVPVAPSNLQHGHHGYQRLEDQLQSLTDHTGFRDPSELPCIRAAPWSSSLASVTNRSGPELRCSCLDIVSRRAFMVRAEGLRRG
jgi:hypothetical protein